MAGDPQNGVGLWVKTCGQNLDAKRCLKIRLWSFLFV